MKLDLKTILPYVVLLTTIAMTWGMWSERLNAVEKKADTVAKMQQDIAIIKDRLLMLDDRTQWIEEFLIKTMDY
jgi:hypothetical protein